MTAKLAAEIINVTVNTALRMRMSLLLLNRLRAARKSMRPHYAPRATEATFA